MDSINYTFYSVKIVNIVYITIIYFIVGYYIAKYVDKICEYIFGTDYTKVSKFALVLEVAFQIIFSLFVSSFVKKNLIDKIPFPLEGVGGFTHLKLKEYTENGGLIWGLALLFYEKQLNDKLHFLISKFKK